jgi:amicyanin
MRTKSAVLTVIGAAVLIVIIGVVVFAGKSNAPTINGNSGMKPMNMSSNSSNSSSSAEQPVSATTVTISNFAYSPASIKVKVGDTVTWTNKDSIGHTVTADKSSSDAPASDLLAQGQSYSFTFKKAGTFTYHCVPHPNMHGSVIVE